MLVEEPQIRLFEDIRHYYFTLMNNSILKDNFNIQIEDNNEYICEYLPGNFHHPNKNGKFGKIILIH